MACRVLTAVRSCRGLHRALSTGSSYYKVVDGVKMDAQILQSAQTAVEGRGDGRISEDDAKKILDAVLDGASVTATERVTCAHILDEFKWTEKAKSYFIREVLLARHLE